VKRPRSALIVTRLTAHELAAGDRHAHQEAACRTWCKLRRVGVVGVVTAAGAAGHLGILDKVLAAPGRPGVVAASLDRYGTDPAAVLRLLSRLGQVGWVAAVAEGIDTAEQPQVDLAWRSLAQMGGWEADGDMRVPHGTPRGVQHAPYGWRWLQGSGVPGDPTRNAVVPDPDEQAVLAVAMELWEQGARMATIERKIEGMPGAPRRQHRGQAIARAIRLELQRRVAARRQG